MHRFDFLPRQIAKRVAGSRDFFRIEISPFHDGGGNVFRAFPHRAVMQESGRKRERGFQVAALQNRCREKPVVKPAVVERQHGETFVFGECLRSRYVCERVIRRKHDEFFLHVIQASLECACVERVRMRVGQNSMASENGERHGSKA